MYVGELVLRLNIDILVDYLFLGEDVDRVSFSTVPLVEVAEGELDVSVDVIVLIEFHEFAHFGKGSFPFVALLQKFPGLFLIGHSVLLADFLEEGLVLFGKELFDSLTE